MLKEDKLKIVPLNDKSEINNYSKDNGFEVIGLYVIESNGEVKLNIGYPSIASYNQVMGNMFGFKENNGKYFLAGDFPEINDRPIYIITITDSLTVDSYSQINGAIVGEYDLVELVSSKNEDKEKRA